MKFNEKLYTLRKAENMTQTELAERLNVSRQAVSRWEMGTAKPEIDTIIAISELFGVTLDELLKNKEEAPELDIPEPPIKGPSFWDFLPKKWWVAGLLAILFRLVPYGIMLFMILKPPTTQAASAGFGSMAWIPLLIALSSVAFAVLVCCFVIALARWLKARKASV